VGCPLGRWWWGWGEAGPFAARARRGASARRRAPTSERRGERRRRPEPRPPQSPDPAATATTRNDGCPSPQTARPPPPRVPPPRNPSPTKHPPPTHTPAHPLPARLRRARAPTPRAPGTTRPGPRVGVRRRGLLARARACAFGASSGGAPRCACTRLATAPATGMQHALCGGIGPGQGPDPIPNTPGQSPNQTKKGSSGRLTHSCAASGASPGDATGQLWLALPPANWNGGEGTEVWRALLGRARCAGGPAAAPAASPPHCGRAGRKTAAPATARWQLPHRLAPRVPADTHRW
jgi:hypothetical protein